MHARDTLYEQIALRLRERCLLIDVDWIYQLVDGVAMNSAIDKALQLERDAHQRGERPTYGDRYRFWTEAFQLELADARRASVTFNSLDIHTRQVFCALIIDERSIEDCVEVGLGNRDALGRTVRDAFRAVLGTR